MPVKPPRGGSTRMDVDVDVHSNPNRKLDKDLSQADTPGRNGVDPGRGADDLKLRNKPFGDDVDLDAILPAPTVTVHPAPLAPQPPVAVHQSLESYWIKSAAQLPAADNEGFRLHKNRHYVDVPEGGTVLIGIDPDSGPIGRDIQMNCCPLPDAVA